MTAGAGRGTSALLAVLPTLTLLAGVALVQVESGNGWHFEPALRLALVVSALAPMAAVLGLKLVAPRGDLFLVAIAGMLVAIGASTLTMLSAASGADGVFYTAIATRHGVFVGAGFAALVGGALIGPKVDQLSRYPTTLLGTALVLTAVTAVLGDTVNGARLWLQIGPARFQPSEIARLLIAAFVAIYLYERRHLVASPWRVGSVDLPPGPYLLPLAGAILGAAGVLIFQNDLGMAALVVLGAFASVAGVVDSRSSIGAAAVVLVVAAVGSYLAVARVRDRFAAWLDPWQDPANQGFQFVLAEYGLAAGGLSGDAAAMTATSVPEVHTDFIIVSVGSQFGWFGATALLVLVALLICRCALAALRARDGFRALLVMSMTGLLGIQVILIVGGTLRALPLTGLTLPLVSYGGTSMVVTLFALGVVAGIGEKT